MRFPFWPTAIGAALFALAGPRLAGPEDRAAGAAFAYEPPEGFAERPEVVVLDGNTSKVWVDAKSPSPTFPARVSVARTSRKGTVEERDLAQIVDGLPATFKDEGITWTHRRHETRTRPDGARVGLIEGDCVKKVTSELMGGVTADVKFRRLQLAFPDDEGTAIVTAQFAEDEAAKFVPVFEASIAKAKGVATRVPGPQGWMVGAWAAGGGVLGFLVGAILGARAAAPSAPAAPAASPSGPNAAVAADAADDEDEDDDA